MRKDEELSAWQEIVQRWDLVAAELSRQIIRCQSYLSDPSKTGDMAEIRILQGELQAYKTLAVLPKRKIEELSKEAKTTNARRRGT